MPKKLVRQTLNEQEFEEQLLLKDRALAATAEGVTISDPSLPDNPLIYANNGFEELTGYSIEEVIGRNCRFLQGPDTDEKSVEIIREAIRNERACTVQILNYKKDGTPFWNRLSITPVRDPSGKVINHIGIQSDITAQKESEAALERTKRQLEAANERMSKDLEAAARIQQSLLPKAPPDVPGIRFAWRFEPSTELAGDLLNLFALDERRIAVYVLDVSGHGVAASLLSVAVSRLLSPLRGHSVIFTPEDGKPGSYTITPPAAVAAKLNENFPFNPETAQYFTLLYGVLDVSSGEFRYVCAGHPPPINVRDGGGSHDMESSGPPLGLLPQPEYQEQTVTLRRGDRLVVYTDGVVEAEDADGSEFGQTRLHKCLWATRKLPIRESLDSVVTNIRRWSGTPSLEDDATIVMLEFDRA